MTDNTLQERHRAMAVARQNKGCSADAARAQPVPAAGDAFSDVLLEQHQGDCIQRINIPNARLVAALPTPSISEDEAVEIMLKHMKAEWLNDTTGWLIPAREAYHALLAAGVIRGV